MLSLPPSLTKRMEKKNNPLKDWLALGVFHTAHRFVNIFLDFPHSPCSKIWASSTHQLISGFFSSNTIPAWTYLNLRLMDHSSKCSMFLPEGPTSDRYLGSSHHFQKNKFTSVTILSTTEGRSSLIFSGQITIGYSLNGCSSTTTMYFILTCKVALINWLIRCL